MSGRIFLAPMLFVSLASNSPASAARSIGGSAVDVGHVFQSGQTDGLILYAMILGTFLMFLIAVGLAFLILRILKNHSTAMALAQADHATAMARKDEHITGNTKLMIEVVDRNAVAMSALSVSVAQDVRERAAAGQTLAEIKALMGKLDNVE